MRDSSESVSVSVSVKEDSVDEEDCVEDKDGGGKVGMGVLYILLT
jgi:hypothetical protein